MKTAICALIKDEHLFLEEWIDWHLGLGFDAIHLFEDKGSKSHEEICAKYSNVYLRRYETDEEVRELLKDQGNSHRQVVLYNYFARQSSEVYSWVGFFDLDEFVMFADNYDLKKLCKEFEPYSAVLLNWKMMGASGHIKRPKCGVMEAYTQECETLPKDRAWCYKSFVNISKFKGFENLHLANGYVNTNYEKIKDNLYFNKCWLNHYFTKSFEDWLDRIYKRGGTKTAHRVLYDFYSSNPNMSYLKELTYEFLASRKPAGTYIISRESWLCSGGNLYDIRLMSCKEIGLTMTDDERLDSAIQEASKYGFKDNGKGKLIHFVWIGNSKMPEIAFKCLDSWKKFAKDYTVCLWNENNADFSLPFVKLAYNEGQYGIAADYIRLETVYKYGGIYLDIDVELIKELPELPENVLALEQTYEDKQGIAPGLIIKAKRGNDIIYDIMSIYKYMYFNAKKLHLYIQPGLFQNYFSARGYKGQNSFLGFHIYPLSILLQRLFSTIKYI